VEKKSKKILFKALIFGSVLAVLGTFSYRLFYPQTVRAYGLKLVQVNKEKRLKQTLGRDYSNRHFTYSEILIDDALYTVENWIPDGWRKSEMGKTYQQYDVETETFKLEYMGIVAGNKFNADLYACNHGDDTPYILRFGNGQMTVYNQKK